MSHQNKVLSKVGCFQLVQRKKDNKKWYEVKFDVWNFGFETEHEIRDFFDPTRSKSGKWGRSWKYKNRKDAEHMFLTATLKWAGNE